MIGHFNKLASRRDDDGVHRKGLFMLSVLPLARTKLSGDSPFIRDGSWCASMRADNKINDLPLRGNLILVTCGRRVTDQLPRDWSLSNVT